MNSFCTYIAQNLIFQKKGESNEIQRSQKDYFLFTTTENIYIYMCSETNQIYF